LLQWTADGTAQTHIDRHSVTSDGRLAFWELKLFYEGDDAKQARITEARRTLKNATYYKDTDKYTFDEYCVKHLKANNDLTKCGVPYDGMSAVNDFLAGIL
jgi:hypothetical protein